MLAGSKTAEGASPSAVAPGPSALAPSPSVGASSTIRVKVWDPVVRLFHWTVVTGCVLNLWVLEDGKYWHRFTGYVIAVVLAIRLVWGFIGTPHARFADFFPTPRRTKAHLSALLTGHDDRYVGHSPLGAICMLLLMGLLASTCLTGWMMRLDAFWGDEWLEQLHSLLSNGILGLAMIHFSAAIIESWRHKENLIWSMITGMKRP